eukprot:593050-Rhodomonas_salina.1
MEVGGRVPGHTGCREEGSTHSPLYHTLAQYQIILHHTLVPYASSVPHVAKQGGSTISELSTARHRTIR